MELLKEKLWEIQGNDCVIYCYSSLRKFSDLYLVEEIRNAKGSWIAYGYSGNIVKFDNYNDAIAEYNRIIEIK